MKITNISITKAEGKVNLKGLVTLTTNDEFAIHNIRIVEGKNGLFVAMPSRKNAKGEFYDICHPTTNDLREEFSKQILDAYNKMEENTHE